MRILFLSRWFPYPPDNGSKLRVFNLLRGLAWAHSIQLITFSEPGISGTAIPEALAALCEEIRVIPWKDFDPESRLARRGYFSQAPRSIIDTFSTQMSRAIGEVCRNFSIDLVIASQIDTAAYRPAFKEVPAVFEEAEVGVYFEQYARAKTLASRLRYGLTWMKYRRYLAALIGSFQMATVVSAREKKLLTHATGRQTTPVEIIPNCVDFAAYNGSFAPAAPDSLIFTGSLTFSPNYEAMKWFLDHVYPQVQARVPGVHLTITGNHANLPLPESTGVRLTGYVDDIRPLLAGSWISLAPIWEGGGTRLKILEALALGTPVVSTTKGAEGLEVRNGEHLLVADTPGDFAEAVNSLLQDHAKRQSLSANGRKLVREKYDWAAVLPGYLDRIAALVPSDRKPLV